MLMLLVNEGDIGFTFGHLELISGKFVDMNESRKEAYVTHFNFQALREFYEFANENAVLLFLLTV